MNHYVYETTNLITGKKYIGKRSCKCRIEDDTYIGSGKYLWNSIRVHGIENFSKEIIYIAESEQEAFSWEKYIIQKYKLYKNRNFYNISDGGCGGNSLAGYSEEELMQYKDNQSKILKKFYSENEHHMVGKNLSSEIKNKISKSHRERYKTFPHHMLGKTLSEETRNKMSISRLNRRHTQVSKDKISKANSGSNNGMYNKGYLIQGSNNGMYGIKGKDHPNSVSIKVLFLETNTIKEFPSKASFNEYFINLGFLGAYKWSRKDRGIPKKYQHLFKIIE